MLPPELAGLELYAYVGEDELGSGEIGLKQGRVPAGFIPIVAIRRDKIDRDDLRMQMRRQTSRYGKQIRLVRFRAEEVVWETL